jgi:hypothetical protein
MGSSQRRNASFFFLLLILCNAKAFAAACCGGAAQIPTLITAEDRKQWTTTLSRQDIFTQVDESGYWFPRPDQYQQILKMDYAQIFSENSQWGVSIPVESNVDVQGNTSATQLGDVAFTVGHRWLEEGFGAVWNPQLVSFFSLSVPSGKSYYESQDPLKLDVTGRGFYQPSVGILLLRTAGAVDAQFSFEIHHGLSRAFNTPSGTSQYNPGWGGSVSLGAGWNYARWRAGGALNQIYDDPIQVTGNPPTSMERSTLASLSVSYLFPDLMTGTLTYADQSWFGAPVSTTLGQTWSVALQKRWPRE